MQREKDLIDEIDDHLETILLAFISFFDSKVTPVIRQRIEELIDNWDNDRSLKGRISRMKSINRLRSQVSSELKEGILKTGYNEFLTGYKTLVTLANQYFSILNEKYNKNSYRELYKQSIEYMHEVLIGSGLDRDVIGPVMNKVYDKARLGVTKMELRKWLREQIGKKGLPTRYVSQIATDALYQMTSSYQNEVAADLGIKHWYYAGTKMQTSRNFCVNRYGRAYTQAEVESWAGLDWQGKIPGTDKKTIFVNRGGYNCRHTLRPISRRAYENFKQNERNGN